MSIYLLIYPSFTLHRQHVCASAVLRRGRARLREKEDMGEGVRERGREEEEGGMGRERERPSLLHPTAQ